MICVVCKKEVNKTENMADIRDEFNYLMEQVDHLGVDSLTENEQVLYEGKVHAYHCFEYLN